MVCFCGSVSRDGAAVSRSRFAASGSEVQTSLESSLATVGILGQGTFPGGKPMLSLTAEYSGLMAPSFMRMTSGGSIQGS
jgi:hypothetical protein